MADIAFLHHDRSYSWQDEQTLSQWLILIADRENLTIQSLSFVYCSDEYLLEINQQFLAHDYYTDVITFDLSNSDAIEGEVYISLDRIQDNSENLNESFERELCRVMAHGLLHLCGYADKSPDEKEVMRRKEGECLSLLSDVPRGTSGV